MNHDSSETPRPAGADHALGFVLDRVRQSAAELLARLEHPPRTLHLRAGDVAISIDWPEPGTAAPAPVPRTADDAAAGGEGRRTVTAQAVGVFYRAPEPGADPFVGEGDLIRPGQQLAIIEAMKLMIPVRSELDGRIVEILKKDGEPVEYGEPLFALAAAETE
jgi:acetyl-CoA carboxylase biotin carboxyl carrier protein